MGELIDQSVERAVKDFLATPLAPKAEVLEGELPFTQAHFVRRVVEKLDKAGKIALLLEMIDDPLEFEFDSNVTGADNTLGIVNTICESFLETKADSVPGVMDRDREQWDAFYVAYPEQA